MVARKLNKPCYKVSRMPVHWLHEVVTSTWRCQNCIQSQPKGSIAFEMWIRNARKGVPPSDESKHVDKARKTYICLQCASDMLEASLDKVNLVKRLGKEALQMFEEI